MAYRGLPLGQADGGAGLGVEGGHLLALLLLQLQGVLRPLLRHVQLADLTVDELKSCSFFGALSLNS